MTAQFSLCVISSFGSSSSFVQRGYSENHPVDTRLGERLSMHRLSHMSQLSTEFDVEPNPTHSTSEVTQQPIETPPASLESAPKGNGTSALTEQK